MNLNVFAFGYPGYLEMARHVLERGKRRQRSRQSCIAATVSLTYVVAAARAAGVRAPRSATARLTAAIPPVGDCLSTTLRRYVVRNVTLADLVRGAQTSRTALPWVNRRSPRWEPEPLRYAAINGGLRVMASADGVEERTGKPAKRGVSQQCCRPFYGLIVLHECSWG